MIALDDAALRGWPLPVPHGESDKEARGRVVVVGGSREVPGAVRLAAEAALRAGAGKVLVATVESAAMGLAIAVPEARVVGLAETASGDIDPAAVDGLAGPLERADALLIGPGLVDDAAGVALAAALLAALPEHAAPAVVLDAAAIGAACAPRRTGLALLVTPHAGEMAHCRACTKDDVQGDAARHAIDAAREWSCVVALKGPRTVIATADGRAWCHEAHEVGLATAGSGDVLAGVIAALAARGAPLEQAAAWGVALHARAGARLARRVGEFGYLARELAADVPSLLDGFNAGAADAAEPSGGVGSARRSARN